MVPADYLEEKTNEELLALYMAEGQLEVKQALVMRYLYIVRTIALQMRNVYAGSLQMEHIINEGVLTDMIRSAIINLKPLYPGVSAE